MGFFSEVDGILKSGVPVALITLIKTKGSTPRHEGAKMAVLIDGRTIGTVGGGPVEALLIARAIILLKSGETEIIEHILTVKEAGVACGGSLKALIEPLRRMPSLYIYGAGHIGIALCRILDDSPFSIHLFDDRESVLESADVPQSVERMAAGQNYSSLPAIDGRRNFAVIATRCHETDISCIRHALKAGLSYICCVGSRNKRKEVEKILSNDNFSKKEIAKIKMPAGLPIGGDSPVEIAISIAAEIISFYHGNPVK